MGPREIGQFEGRAVTRGEHKPTKVMSGGSESPILAILDLEEGAYEWPLVRNGPDSLPTEQTIRIAGGHSSRSQITSSGEISRVALWRGTPSVIWMKILEESEPVGAAYRSAARRESSSLHFHDGVAYAGYESHPCRRRHCMRMEFGRNALLPKSERRRSRSSPWSLGGRRSKTITCGGKCISHVINTMMIRRIANLMFSTTS